MAAMKSFACLPQRNNEQCGATSDSESTRQVGRAGAQPVNPALADLLRKQSLHCQPMSNSESKGLASGLPMEVVAALVNPQMQFVERNSHLTSNSEPAGMVSHSSKPQVERIVTTQRNELSVGSSGGCGGVYD